MKFDTFREISLSEWNISSNPIMALLREIVDLVLNNQDGDPADNEITQLLQKVIDNWDDLKSYFTVHNVRTAFMMRELENEIAKRINLGASHPEVQMLVKLFFEKFSELKKETFDITGNITQQEFVQCVVSTFLFGDTALFNENLYGRKECDFIIDAMAYFGWYTDDNEIDKSKKGE